MTNRGTAIEPAALEPTVGAPIEVVTPIKPSEAIRLGCLIAPVQAFGEFRDGPGTACAIGALAYGWGWDGAEAFGDRATHPIERALDAMDVADADMPPCPDCDLPNTFVAHLNDDHRWSRERIADWLEGLGL